MSSLNPIKFSDSITKRDVRDERFPIETKNIDTTIQILRDLSSKLELAKTNNAPLISEYRADNLLFQAVGVRMAYGTRMNITISNQVGKRHYNTFLCRSSTSNSDNIKKIEKLIELLLGYNK